MQKYFENYQEYPETCKFLIELQTNIWGRPNIIPTWVKKNRFLKEQAKCLFLQTLIGIHDKSYILDNTEYHIPLSSGFLPIGNCGFSNTLIPEKEGWDIPNNVVAELQKNIGKKIIPINNTDTGELIGFDMSNV